MRTVVELNLINFGMVYLLLIIVLAIMKKARINQSRLLLVASVRMTVQLVLAGLILTYIFKNPHPLFTVIYLGAMILFAIHRVLSKHKNINRSFQLAVAASIAVPGFAIVLFFIEIIIKTDLFNPQYVIPISGMIIGNTMTGVSLGMKAFTDTLSSSRNRIETLLNLGVTPKKILLPMVNHALETALLPTLNSMLGMGIVSLPGMMTGQILSGTLPSTAILYQIAIMISICTAVCLTVFSSLYFGYRTLYNSRSQITVY